MKKSKLALGILLGIGMYFTSFVASPMITGPNTSFVIAHAEDELGDDINGDNGSSDETGVGDFISNFKPMTEEQMQTSSQKVSPITNIFGYLIGGIVALVTAGIFVITALDLAYIAIPFTRNLLYVDGQPQGGGMMGGYGMGMQQQSTHEKRQWISDEAVQCAALLGNNQQSQPQGGMMGGYGSGYGMGSMQGTAQQANMPVKSVVMTYFKKRAFFLIIFAVASIMLTSSIFLGTGVNLAQWGMKIMTMINDSISSLG